MNKKVDLLVDEPCPELLCGICLDVLEDPMQVHCPEDHMYCSKCITNHIQQHSNCPICLTELDKTSFQLSKFVQRQISRLRIKCLYTENGCLWTGTLSDDHITTCEYKPSKCPNASQGCDVTNLNNVNMEEHLKSCLYQTMTCPNNMPLCQPFLLKDLSLHENQCQSYACPYAAEGCSFMGTLPETNTHCDLYCRRLHKKVTDLEEEVKRLNKLIQDITLGLDIKLPSTPDANMQEEDKKQHDAAMDELDLFQQMFNDESFAGINLSPNNLTVMAGPSTTSPLGSKAMDNMMDLNACLPEINFLNTEKDTKEAIKTDTKDTLDFDSLFESVTSPQPLQFAVPLNAPKRSSNGKKIRYSKNKPLAHNAFRMARQRTATNHNPTNDAILNNLDIAKQKQNQVAFKNQDDVTKFLNTEPAKSPSTATTKVTAAKKEKKKSVSSPQQESSTSSNSTPKRRPMFILASSYLSNYNNNNDKV